jgi:hypothetical protein
MPTHSLPEKQGKSKAVGRMEPKLRDLIAPRSDSTVHEPIRLTR